MYITGINSLLRQLQILQENFFPWAGINDLSFLLAEAEQATRDFTCPVALLDWRSVGTSFPMAVQRLFWEIRFGHCHISTWLQGTDSVYMFGNGSAISTLCVESILPPHEEEMCAEQTHEFSVTGNHGESVRIRFANIEISSIAARQEETLVPATIFDVLLLHLSNPGICLHEEVLCSNGGYFIGLGQTGTFAIRTSPRGSVGKRITSVFVYPANRVPHEMPGIYLSPSIL